MLVNVNPVAHSDARARKRKKTGAREEWRTTVSFAGVVRETMEQNMELGGYNNNVSAYLAQLVRNDRERLLQQARLDAAFIAYQKSRGLLVPG